MVNMILGPFEAGGDMVRLKKRDRKWSTNGELEGFF
jgi:hypothetical protein